MKHSSLSSCVVHAAVSLLCVGTLACGGGGGLQGGISGTGIVFGTITAIGNDVIVNGISFDDDTAAVIINGTAGVSMDLRLGMVVTITGLVDVAAGTGVADQIEFDADITGPVEAIDVTAGTIQVLAQLIITDAQTQFDGTTLATLGVGQTVEISGFADGDGLLRASRVSLEDSDQEIELVGVIENLDSGASTFGLGLLVVDFSNAAIENEPTGGLSNGLRVEALGSAAPVGGVFTADRIKVVGNPPIGREGDELEIEGFVTSILSPSEFVINTRTTVRITAQTQFSDGNASSIVLNARIEVNGIVDSSDILVAREIEFENEN